MKMRVHSLVACLCLLGLWGCGEEENTSSSLGSSAEFDLELKKQERAKKNKVVRATHTLSNPPSDRPAGRAAVVLTRDSFAQGARDPFESYSEGPSKPVVADLPKKRQREVRFSGYNFEDLRLIAIVRSGKNIPPRALFVASDGVSKSIRQGDYFSRSEVLLASVNSDYVEIEIVDEELAQGLNMEQGERRAIYLKQE